MDPFATELNLLFMHTYRSIHNVEEAMLKSLSNGSLSIGEMHIIECIGRGGNNGASITAIAQDMEISLPSATVAVKKLERKGFVLKSRGGGRRAPGCMCNSRKPAARAEVAHRYFHRQMLKAVCQGVREEEKPVLLGAIRSLNEFFDKAVSQLSAQADKKGGMQP